MRYLTAAVVLVGLLGLLNLLLLVGVLRRLRRDRGHAGAEGAAPALLQPGAEVGDFAAVTLDGERVSRDALTEQTLVAFFSPDCGPCHELLPSFVTHAGRMPAGRRQVLAVLAGDPGDPGATAAQAATLSEVARVVVERPGGQLGAAFCNQWYPTVYLVGPDHRVQASGNQLDALLAGVPAAA